MRTEVYVDELI